MLALVGALFCVVANGFFVAAEFSFAKVRPTSLEAAAKTDPAAARALFILRHLDEYLAATQLGITLASLGLGSLGEDAGASLLQPILERFGLGSMAHGLAFAISLSVISSLHVVVGELVPKSLALMRAEQIAKFSSTPLRLFYFSVYPALWLLNRTSNFVLRAMRLPAPDHAEGKLSLEELHLLIAASLPGDDAQKQRDILERVLRATDRPVRAIMIPRVDMHILSITDDPDTALGKMRKHGYSRYPVSRDENPDHVTGYVYLKDLLLREGKERPTVASLKRDILIVPESRTVGEILEEFQSSKIPIALVVDEYGGTSGLVTLEDAVAELVGDLTDELKGGGKPRIVREADGSIVVDGALAVDDLDLDGMKLPEIENADTVGGYVVASLERLAVPGDKIDIDGWEIVVEDVRQRRVNRVRFCPVRPGEKPTSVRPESS